jgi:acetyl esterase
MPLDPDAQAVVAHTKEYMPLAFNEMAIEDVRRVRASQQPLIGPPVHEVIDRAIPGPHGAIPIRVYRPSGEAGLPVFVWIHGGGWSLGDLGEGDVVDRMISNQAGCLIVSVDYRLAPEHKFPVPFEDCLAAVQWVAQHAAKLGGDPARLAIGGDSAGGNLSAAVALAVRDLGGPAISLQVLVYPATEYAVERPSWRRNREGPLLTAEDVIWFWGLYLRDAADRTDPRAVPTSAKTLAGLPPAFILVAEYDPLCDDGLEYGRLLAEAGVKVTSKRYDGVFHGFFGMPGIVAKAAEAIDDVAAALRDTFASTPIEV